MRIIVFGGTGFLGSRIVNAALKANHTVTIVSRSPQRNDVHHIQADIMNPESYRSALLEADAAVHSIGIFMKNPGYKQLVSKPLGPSTLLNFVKSQLAGPNPLDTTSFKSVNTDTAAVLANEFSKIAAEKKKRLPLVYISAEEWSKFADKEYIESKREAEALIQEYSQLRPLLFRPGFMYDPKESNCVPSIRDLISTGLKGSEALGGPSPRVSVDSVAAAVVEAISDESIEGVIPLSAIKEFEVLQTSQYS